VKLPTTIVCSIIVGLFATIVMGCSSSEHDASSGSIVPAGGTDAGVDKPDSAVLDQCHPVQGQPIPARLAVMSQDAGTATTTEVFVDDIYNRFNSTCGGCHVAAQQGGFQVNRSTFINVDTQLMLARMQSDDPAFFMPPPVAGGIPASQRSPDDPVAQLVVYIQQWVAAGKPVDVFSIATQSGTTGSDTASFALTTPEGNALTNIGSCLPDKGIVGTAVAKMDELDAYFSQLQATSPGQGTLAEQVGLPELLSQTDLTTLNTEELAKQGLIAYAPAYPLWSDNADKLRLIRVPRGRSIVFDKTAQQFKVPTNTRFYKTFLKKITDSDGSTRDRKIETRLIVSRPDQQLADGSYQPTALYGTYVWNDDETEAVLLTDPLRNGEPFADRLITYVTDVPVAEQVAATNPVNLTYALQNSNAIRHYAIPSSDRCLDCHRGSSSQSFVLGFSPLQVKRRPQGEGGIIEPATQDELTQLQRLIDYGVITGIESPDDIANLEDSQGSRKPRNQYELTAQGYMMGNCAHCHNPNGDASVDNPVLADVLNFLPGPDGGIFQFPLDKLSPRISRGSGGNVPIPYITPSLADYPVEDSGTHLFWTPKADAELRWQTNANVVAPPPDGLPGHPNAAAFAPWRSLIYRNVDTPFAYSDDFALFPHMPKNVPGFDCRLPTIMGDWMVSIPARRKNTSVWEYGVPLGGTCISGTRNLCDNEPQPYEEVLPSESDYATALADAQQRLGMYHGGTPSWMNPTFGPFISRYTFCPDTSDIVDPSIVWGRANACSPKLVPLSGTDYDVTNNVLVQPDLGVPLHAHWVTTDLTQAPGDWNPRRPDWEQVLVEQNFPTISGSDCSLDLQKQASEKVVVRLLQNVTITPSMKAYALSSIPFGLWQTKSSCDLSAYPTISQLKETPKWVAQAQPPVPPNSPVYTELPGAAVFNMVCTNCHGPSADSLGRLASNLMTMTGGAVQVADLRDGLFGPVGTGTNRPRIFGQTAAQLGITADDLSARYLAWMTLGGTKAQLPASILNIVGNTQVLGVSRKSNQFESISASSANMLATAQELCRHVLPWQPGYDSVPFDVTTGTFNYDHSALIPTNGDAELWQELCSVDNDPPIRGLTAVDWTKTPVSFNIYPLVNLYRPAGYPPNTAIGNQKGQIVPSLQSDNTMPWCLLKPTNSSLISIAEQYVVDNAVNGTPLPLCPDSLTTGNYQMQQTASDPGSANNDLQNWATRGAINAGIAVFSYLDQVVAHGLNPQPAYDHCELLTQ